MSSANYIGCKISLTSKSGNRYEGVLKAVDPATSTICLNNVKVFGTEGRRPGQEVPPSREVYAEVSFKSSDIEDLRVYERSAPSALAGLPSDPAIVSAKASEPKTLSSAPAKSAPVQVSPETTSAPRKPAQASASSFTASNTISQASPKPAPTFTPGVRAEAPKAAPAAVPNNAARSYASVVGVSTPTANVIRSGPSVASKPAGQTYASASHYNRGEPVLPKTDFDFERANARLGSHSTDSEGNSFVYYNKAKSFFDEISSDSKPLQSSNPGSFHEDRRINSETFGFTAVQQQQNQPPHYRNYNNYNRRGSSAPATGKQFSTGSRRPAASS